MARWATTAMPNLASSNARVSTVEGIIEVPQEDTPDDASAMSGFRVWKRAKRATLVFPARHRSAARGRPRRRERVSSANPTGPPAPVLQQDWDHFVGVWNATATLTFGLGV
jgi:hypothetical protein